MYNGLELVVTSSNANSKHMQTNLQSSTHRPKSYFEKTSFPEGEKFAIYIEHISVYKLRKYYTDFFFFLPLRTLIPSE